MKATRYTLIALALASAAVFAAEEPLEPAPPAPGIALAATDDPAKLKQQLADALELSGELRNQIDTTIAQADAAAAERDQFKQDADVLRQQRDALQARVTELQRLAQVADAAPAKPDQNAELLRLREQLALASVARDGLSADARNLAGELRNTRADRDKYQRSSIENAQRNTLLQADLQACRSGLR